MFLEEIKVYTLTLSYQIHIRKPQNAEKSCVSKIHRLFCLKRLRRVNAVLLCEKRDFGYEMLQISFTISLLLKELQCPSKKYKNISSVMRNRNTLSTVITNIKSNQSRIKNNDPAVCCYFGLFQQKFKRAHLG